MLEQHGLFPHIAQATKRFRFNLFCIYLDICTILQSTEQALILSPLADLNQEIDKDASFLDLCQALKVLS